jgi:hypothetical protein
MVLSCSALFVNDLHCGAVCPHSARRFSASQLLLINQAAIGGEGGSAPKYTASGVADVAVLIKVARKSQERKESLSALERSESASRIDPLRLEHIACRAR